MIGILLTSIISGVAITKTGYYWQYPIIGAFFIALGAGLIGGLLAADTNFVLMCFFVFLIGVGIGSLIQVINIFC
jgi:hypothetical protein